MSFNDNIDNISGVESSSFCSHEAQLSLFYKVYVFMLKQEY